MEQGVGVAGIYVRDQDEAIDFYVGRLGFGIHTDARNGDSGADQPLRHRRRQLPRSVGERLEARGGKVMGAEFFSVDPRSIQAIPGRQARIAPRLRQSTAGCRSPSP